MSAARTWRARSAARPDMKKRRPGIVAGNAALSALDRDLPLRIGGASSLGGTGYIGVLVDDL